jgi:ribosomal-protein-alanine N-acetyltransferase
LKAVLEENRFGQPQRLEIVPMSTSDIADVMRIERDSFTTTWPNDAFHTELRSNKVAHYFIGRIDGRTVAYGGIWVVLEDSHVTTIAVDPNYRGKKYGERLLCHLIDEAIELGAAWMTLEVRESNDSAKNLYRKYGFTVVNLRRAYYSDNSENALVMWAGNLRGDLYRNRLRALRASLER